MLVRQAVEQVTSNICVSRAFYFLGILMYGYTKITINNIYLTAIGHQITYPDSAANVSKARRR